MTPQDELLKMLEEPIADESIIVENSSEGIFGELSNRFPLTGSKIDWDEVPGSIVDINENVNDLKPLIGFFEKIYIEERLSGNVIYINDGPIDCALILSIDITKKHLEEILGFPGHHYFISERYLWCMSFTMEGDMAFGYSQLTQKT